MALFGQVVLRCTTLYIPYATDICASISLYTCCRPQMREWADPSRPLQPEGNERKRKGGTAVAQASAASKSRVKRYALWIKEFTSRNDEDKRLKVPFKLIETDPKPEWW